MSIEELVHKATMHGNSLGQIALCEFLIKTYGEDMSPNLVMFLERLLQAEYENVGKNVGKPAEDVASEVAEVVKRH